MRQLKFRAFDKRFKKMDFGLGDLLLRCSTDDFEPIMQYTGFKDKNGKEIYEGDILSDWTKTEDGIMQSFMQVYWCERFGNWKLDYTTNQDKSSGWDLWLELRDYEYEVTGNIYETPDLLIKNLEVEFKEINW